MPGKTDLRRQFRNLLALMPQAARAAASQRLCDHLFSWENFIQAKVVALFYPTATEPDLRPLTQTANKTFLFPHCHADRTLSWHPLESMADWRLSQFGILEPDPTRIRAWTGEPASLILVPGLAFTHTGQRLGHGAGFYDRFLSTLTPATVTAGICFSCQITGTLPAEPHDIPVQHVFHA